MNKLIIYILVIIFSNTIGALSGMGGGVIIKPVLDFFALDTIATISLYSATAVLTMSMVSTIRQIKNGMRFDFGQVSSLSIGSILGGYLGDTCLTFLLEKWHSEKNVLLLQIVLTVAMLLFAFLSSLDLFSYMRLDKSIVYIVSGIFLGWMASFLGIGGGPINVSLLMILFSLPIKRATVYSITIIFCSQATKLINVLFIHNFHNFEFSILLGVILAASIGGVLGAYFSKILSDKQVIYVFRYVILLVIVINIYNGIRLFL